MECHYCGGRLEKRHVEHVGRWGEEGRWVLVKDVPALVCTQCGERFFLPGVADVLSQAVQAGGAAGAPTVPMVVREFSAAAVQ